MDSDDDFMQFILQDDDDSEDEPNIDEEGNQCHFRFAFQV